MASITETTTAQHNQSTTAESPGDGGSVTAVIVVLVLAMATGCIITCTVVVWKRTRARKNEVRKHDSIKNNCNTYNLEVCKSVHKQVSIRTKKPPQN